MRRIKRLAARLVAVFQSATRAVKRQGADWYRLAGAAARSMARKHGVTRACAAGVIAALSPRLTWSYNVRAAELTLQGGDVPGVFRASLAKARRIAAGERPLSVLSGPKVRAFYRALMGDTSAAVVDVWTARAAGVLGDAGPARLLEVASALRLAAAEVGRPVAHVQATAWVVVRGRAA